MLIKIKRKFIKWCVTHKKECWSCGIICKILERGNRHTIYNMVYNMGMKDGKELFHHPDHHSYDTLDRYCFLNGVKIGLFYKDSFYHRRASENGRSNFQGFLFGSNVYTKTINNKTIYYEGFKKSYLDELKKKIT